MDREGSIQDKTYTTVIRKIDDTFVVWFPNGNQYLRLEEPAYFVFQSHREGVDAVTIARRCAVRYQTGEEECRQFVFDILDRIGAITRMPVRQAKDLAGDAALSVQPFSPFSIHQYSVYGKSLCFQFGTRWHEQLLHPLLQHLEVVDGTSKPVLFELFGHKDRNVLRVGHRVKGSWDDAETHLLNGMVSLQLANAVYGKVDHDWMAVIHASAVTNGAKTMIFPATPGSGKSTLAALLHQKGFPIVSDDFVLIDRQSRQVFPFPAAVSVKEGSTQLLSVFYPSLRRQEKAQQSRTNKLVRYLPIAGETVAAPVQEIIFVRYDPTVDFELEQLLRPDALAQLLDETWTAPTPENAGSFLDWYSGLACYRLRYSNNDLALQKITELFER